MAAAGSKRSKGEAASLTKGSKSSKRIKIRHEYHSSSDADSNSSADFAAVDLLDESGDESEPPLSDGNNPNRHLHATKQAEGASSFDDINQQSTDATSDSEASTATPLRKRKRNDPDAFATSMSKILASKLTSVKRADPVLSRSTDAQAATKELADSKLEVKARHKIREQKRAAFDRDRVKDVLGLDNPEASTAELVEQERRLRKTAQRGVVKLFNAVRAAQVKGEEAAREARKAGVIGMAKREVKVNEMSRKGFLDLIAAGGKKSSGPTET